MIYIAGIIAIVIVLIYLGNRSSKKLNIRIEELRNSAIAEGEAAAELGARERDCPHMDGGDPKNVPLAALLLFREGSGINNFEGLRFWWLAGYRHVARNRPRPHPDSVANHQEPASDRPSPSGFADPWFEETIKNMLDIYRVNPDHDRHGSEVIRELSEIGEAFYERGGMTLMRTAHAEFARRCTLGNIRDRSGHLSAPRSLEYRWHGIGSWQG